jgi:amino acid transporter
MGETEPGGLRRHFGLLHATALNVTMVVGAGIFVTVPLILRELPGPWALLAWVAGAALMLLDGLVWSELGAMLPASGGTYGYLLEGYGRHRAGRMMAFLFIWQFLLSGPLEIASGLIVIAQLTNALSPHFAQLNNDWTRRLWLWEAQDLSLTVGPARLAAVLVGVVILLLLYRRITSLGRWTVTFWLGVLAALAWVLAEGALRFDPAVAFDFSGEASGRPAGLGVHLGPAMTLALYAYLGYYNVCYIGDEVRDPGRTIPGAILLSAVLVFFLFIGMHLALLGTISWHDVPLDDDDYNLPAAFMAHVHGSWAPRLLAVLIIWCCVGSAFCGLLGYARIPYGAARCGHFFAAFGRVHPVHHIPHVSLLALGALTLFWTFFDLQTVITALLTLRILEQFLAQTVALVLLRLREPGRPRPFRLWLYPLPCGLVLAGWLYVYLTSPPRYIFLGLTTLTAGAGAFLLWSWRAKNWPFGAAGAGEKT